MRFVPSRALACSVGVALLTAPLSAQTSPVIWSGVLQAPSAPPEPLRYQISPLPARTFVILHPSDTGQNAGVTVSDIEFTGLSVRFTAPLGEALSCKLDAIPARGYKGTCTLQSGERREMTLVPPVPGMLLPEHEIMLLRDAAPPQLSGTVTVFVMGPDGLSQAVRGTNGFTCFVRRPTVNDFWPICQNQQAANLVVMEQLRAELRIAGLDERRVADSIAAGFRSGRLPVASRGGIGYMLSSFAWTMDPTSGAQVFLPPHLHFAAPYATSAGIGVDSTEKNVLPMRVEESGMPDASVIVGVRRRDRT